MKKDIGITQFKDSKKGIFISFITLKGLGGNNIKAKLAIFANIDIIKFIILTIKVAIKLSTSNESSCHNN